jgi:hypothetical protein
MALTRQQIVLKVHLVISLAVVVPAAFIYGFFSESVLDITIDTVDESNLLKGIMGLYLAFSLVWFLALFKDQFLMVALVSNMLFMLGLGLGRILSIILDGFPSLLYSFGFLGELVLGLYGLWLMIWYVPKNKVSFLYFKNQ